MYHIVIEQTYEYKKRMEFDSSSNSFIETEVESLMYARDFHHPYGWIKESGAPPGAHMDVFLLSNKKYSLGDEVAINIVGCFMRNDGDHKLIAVLPERHETDFFQLPEEEQADMHRLYPRVSDGEGWYGADKARELIDNYYKTHHLHI